jgi:hypothetical protein
MKKEISPVGHLNQQNEMTKNSQKPDILGTLNRQIREYQTISHLYN